MHLHIGGGIIILVTLGIIGVVLAVAYAIRIARRPTVVVTTTTAYDNRSSSYSTGENGYQTAPQQPPVGYAYPSQPQTRNGLSTGEAVVGGMIAGALLENALTPRGERTTIIENNYIPPARIVEEDAPDD